VVLKIGWIADIDLLEQTLVSMICFGNEEANRSQKLFGGYRCFGDYQNPSRNPVLNPVQREDIYIGFEHSRNESFSR